MTIDCDVLQADGGTRTAAITGAWVAAYDAFEMWKTAGRIKTNPCLARLPPSALVWLKAALCSTSITRKIRTPKST